MHEAMKGFFQSLLGSLAAFAMLCFGATVALFVLIGVLASIGEQPVIEVQANSVLVLDLNTNIQDTPPLSDFETVLQEALTGETQPTTHLLNVIESIKLAAYDDAISALLLHGNLQARGYGSGLAAISEVRQAIQAFKNSGKPVYAYLVSPTQKDYYLSSVADEVWINPFGMISLNGLASTAPFLGSALEKYGIGVQTTRVGNYKSAVELFTRSSMSDADREQMTVLLSDLWQSLLSQIGNSREINLNDLNQLSSEQAFFTAEAAQSVKLIDQIGYLDELIGQLSETYHEDDSENSFRQIDLVDYAYTNGIDLMTSVKDGERIAVVYAEGDIIDGGKYPGYVGGDWLASELRRLRHDDDIKAVVLRVNSPGGSAVASEVIQRETRLLAEQKPLIVSMGSYAASGGYWISAYADTIYAQPYTITGSIGVFGLVFNIKEAAANFAVHFDGVKTAPFADIYSPSRPRTEHEMELIQTFTDEIYDAFIAKVAEGRELETSRVSELAQGRVWSGLSAQQLALTDRIGGLDEAIAEASQLAGLEQAAIEQVPSPANFADTLATWLEESGAAPVAHIPGPINELSSHMEAISQTLRSLNDPRNVYARMPYGLEDL